MPVTAVIINYKTEDLVRKAIESFRRYYPAIPLLLIDNGSQDGSTRYLLQCRESFPERTDLIINETNLHHGPAMDQAIRSVKTPLILFLDSDCEIHTGGLIEMMLHHLGENPNSYAVGKKIYMNDRGFDVPPGPGAREYIRPICMILRREIYLTIPPFTRHGAPCLENMKTASEKGFTLVNFPVESYIVHRGRGTAGRHGYRLGLRGRVNHILNKLGF